MQSEPNSFQVLTTEGVVNRTSTRIKVIEVFHTGLHRTMVTNSILVIIRMIRNPDAVVVVANHHLTQEIDALPVELCVILVRFGGITAVCAGQEQAKELVW